MFDVERFRAEPRRLAVAREVVRPTLVLGSTQPRSSSTSPPCGSGRWSWPGDAAGEGPCISAPGEQLWLDVWVPRDDPLWVADVSAAAEWVGAWWSEALAGIGQQGFDVHHGRSVPGALGDLVCFAGRGPGEVFHGAAKVVGLSQWRAREGALFSSCAYLRWDPAPLLALVDVEEGARAGLARDLAPMAAGLAELEPPAADVAGVCALLLDSFPAFGVTPPSE